MNKLVLALDATQISEALKCPYAWALSYREHLSKADQVTTALDEGSLIHSLLDCYYTVKAFSPNKNIFEIAKNIVLIFTENKCFEGFGVDHDRWTFLAQRFVQYLCKNINSDFNPVMSKGRPGVELGFSKVLLENSKYLFIVEGRIDLLVTINDETLWVDHKTQQQAGNLYRYTPQFMTYAWATGLNKAIINYIRLHKEYNEKYTLVKELITFPAHRIAAWEQRMIELFYKLATVMESFKDGFVSEAFEQRFESCAGAFNKTPCQFTPLCETDDLAMRESIKNFQFTRIKPWKPWEIK